MAIQTAPLPITFAGGIDSKTDAKQVAPTKLVDLQNCVFTKNGTLSKRNGYRALGQLVDSGNVNPVTGQPIPGGLAPYADATGIAQRGDELVLFAGGDALSYRPSSDTWDSIGPVSSIAVSAEPLARTGTDQTQPDMADNGGVTVAAWEDNRGGVWCSALESNGLRILLAPVQLDPSGTKPKCVAVGSVLHVLWVNGFNLWCAIVNPALPETTPVPILLTSDLDDVVAGGDVGYDVCPTYLTAFPAIQPALLVWGSSNANGYTIAYLHPSGVIGSPVTGLPSAGLINVGQPANAIACAYWLGADEDNGTASIVVAYDAGSDTFFRYHSVLNLNDLSLSHGTLLAQEATRLSIQFADTDGDGSQALCWWAVEAVGVTASISVVYSGLLSSTGTVVQNTPVRGHQLASRAFNDNGDVYVALLHPVLYFPYVAVCRISGSMTAQARLLPGLSSGTLPRNVLPDCFAMVDPNASVALSGISRQHALALGYRIQLSGTSGTQFGEQGIYRFVFDFDHDEAFRWAQLGRGLYLSGGLIQHYDGQRWAEADFHCAPDTTAGTIAATPTTGGSLTTSSSYVYKFMYEEIDGQGELHPGPTSVGTLVALTGGNDAVSIAIPTYRLTSKLRVRIGIFRSLANATGDPEQIPYFRVSSVDPTTSGAAANGCVGNDSTVDTVTFVDRMSDATAETLEPLYTNGGILSNAPPPQGGEIIAVGKSRLFWNDPTDPNVVRYSQQLRDDTAAEMSDSLSQRIDPLGGDIVAISIVDDNVIVFKETAIFAFGGPGPDADGGLTTQDAFTAPQLVTSDVGCLSPSSICQAPSGIMFQSQKGIYMLGRDLQVQRIGDDVFAYNGQTITRATLVPDAPHVIFLTNSGRTLLLDYDRGQWSTLTNHEGQDALVYEGNYTYLRNDGRVFVATPGLYADGTQHIPMLIETAWIKFNQYLQGWQKVIHALIIGEYESPHALRVRFRLDYEPAYSTLPDINVNSVYTPRNYGDLNYGDETYGGIVGVSSVTYQEKIHLNKRCQAISFRFEDVEAATDFGSSFELSELLLIGGGIGPDFKPGAARQS